MATYDADGEKRLSELLRRNERYPREAYEFVSEALAYTARMLDREGHVTGAELCDGSRQLALEQFGFMARRVLESWNVRCTTDFGRIVYAMIDAELLRKTETDSISDFDDIYDFEEAFDQAFRIELKTPH
ncbi:MAG: hypothetical protein JXL80_09835 [Planctomycetes bacterium]|nr:hypothetical protein [Planctomycetota bacterium]